MAIVTLSRGTFAGGQVLAGLIAQALGYSTVSRELLYERVRERYGYSESELTEIMDRAPSRFDHSAERRRRLFIAVQACLCELVKDDNVVYHGQAGHLLLPGISHVLRVRLIAPRARRIEMAIQREGLNRFEAGRKIDLVDTERARWTQFVFGANWADPSLYDLVLNLECMNIEEAARCVTQAATLPSFRTTEGSLGLMLDLALTSLVRARLITDPTTSQIEVKVHATGGRVRLTGILSDKDLARVTEVVQQAEGVQDVDVEVQVGERRD